jgi:hypothetical protein
MDFRNYIDEMEVDSKGRKSWGIPKEVSMQELDDLRTKLSDVIYKSKNPNKLSLIKKLITDLS